MSVLIENIKGTRFWEAQADSVNNYFSFQVGGVLVNYFARDLPAGSHIVDYGAGAGFLIEDLLTFNGKNFLCAGVENSTLMAERLDFKFRNHKNYLLTVTPDSAGAFGYFDALFLVEVIEHLTDNELDATLALANKLLRPKGRIIVTTPNEEVIRPNHPFGHVRSWNDSALILTLTRANFIVSKCEATNFNASIHADRRTRLWPNRLVRSLAHRLSGHKPHLYAIGYRK